MESTDSSFRDHTSFVDQEGHRKWLYPKKPVGNYYKWRSIVAYFLLAVFFSGPFIKIGGQPIMMINVLERKFIILGKIFWPEDFYLLGLCLIAFVVFIALFTSAFGRLWCGWTCPQTVFMEMIFRKIEYFFEGDGPAQMALDRAKFTLEKAARKTGKWSVFFLISFLISNTFLAYIIGAEEWWMIISSPISEHLQGFGSIILFSLVFFFVFAWAREQVCIVICPYGRLQSVLIDKNSLAVTYDNVRGEPRKHFNKKEEDRKPGGCIDCHQCVAVCPMGIDIRNGSQLECTGCTACIDACDTIMDKLEWPRGLIRHDTVNNIENNVPFRISGRMKAYAGVLTAILILISVLLFNRKQVEAIVLRVPGTMYQMEGKDMVTNVFNLKLINKTNKNMPIGFRLVSPKGEITIAGGAIILPSKEHIEKALFLKINKAELSGLSTPIFIEIYNNEGPIETVKTNFVGPVSYKH